MRHADEQVICSVKESLSRMDSCSKVDAALSVAKKVIDVASNFTEVTGVFALPCSVILGLNLL